MDGAYSVIKEVLFEQGAAFLPVSGSSMSLGLAGKRVKIVKVRPPFRKGKIYIFVFKNRLYIHRLIGVSGKRARFLGDRSDEFEKVPLDAVIGELARQQSAVIRKIIHGINFCFIRYGRTIPGCSFFREKTVALISFLGEPLHEREI
jgi:hypothetical protein